MKIPKNGIKIDGTTFTMNGFWYGSAKRYGKQRYFKSHNCRFDNTCGGTEEIQHDEFLQAAKLYAEIFKN